MENQEKALTNLSQQRWKSILEKNIVLLLFEQGKELLICDKLAGLTIADAVQSRYPLLAFKKANETFITAFVIKLLKELKKFIPNNLTDDDLISYAEAIIQDSDFLRPEDLYLILQNGKRGMYGKIYGNFNYQVFNEWRDAYLKEKEEFIYSKHLSVVEKNGCREDNKLATYRERMGISGEPKTIGKVIPDEKYFKLNEPL